MKSRISVMRPLASVSPGALKWRRRNASGLEVVNKGQTVAIGLPRWVNTKGKTGSRFPECSVCSMENAIILLQYGLKAARRAPQFSKR